MGRIWDRYQPALDLAEIARDALQVLVLYVAPTSGVTIAIVAYLARTGHNAAAWLTIGVVGITGIAIARTQPSRSAWLGRCWDRLRSAHPTTAAIDKARWFVRDMTIALVVMWIVCLVLLWVLEDTSLLAIASRYMPVNSDGIGHQALNAGGATQVLSTLTSALPALLVVLIAAGALHRPQSPDRSVTKGGTE